MAHNKFSDWTQDEKDALLSLRKRQFSTTHGKRDVKLHSPQESDSDEDLEIDVADFHEQLATQQALRTGDCGEGYFWHNRWQRCRRCSSGCKSCTSRRKCDECKSEEMIENRGKCSCPNGPLNDDGTCGDSCPEGYYFHNWSGRCRRCGWNCTSCEKWYQCDSCANGFTPRRGFCYCASGVYGENFECLGGTCDADQYSANGECRDCPSGCATCEDETGVCTSCNESYEGIDENGFCFCPSGSNDNGEECVTCASNEYFNGNYCEPCSENCDSCGAIDNCYQCSETFVTDDFGYCRCPDGKYNDAGYCVVIPTCLDGEYWSSESKTCEPCHYTCSEC